MSHSGNRARSNSQHGHYRSNGHEVMQELRRGGDAEITGDVLMRAVAVVIRDEPDYSPGGGPATRRLIALVRLCRLEGI